MCSMINGKTGTGDTLAYNKPHFRSWAQDSLWRERSGVMLIKALCCVEPTTVSTSLLTHSKMHSFSNGCCACFKWATLYILTRLFSSKELCWCKSTLARASSESAGSDRHVLANSGQCVEICLPGYKNKCTKACPRLHGSDVLSSKAWRC